MRLSKILLFSFTIAALYSCDDNKMDWGRDPAYGEVSTDELPENEDKGDVVLDEDKGLKDYVTDSNFKLGIGMGMDLFTYNDTYFEIASANFNDIAAGYSMKHDPMVTSTGEIQYSKLDKFFNKVKEADMSLFGHCLIWHSNQDRTWLKSVVENAKGEGSTEPGEGEDTDPEPQEIELINTDFESNTTDDWYSWTSKGAEKEVSVVNEGYDSNYGMLLNCTAIDSSPEYWHCQAAADFADSYKLEKNVTYKLSFSAKSEKKGVVQIQLQNANGGNGCWYKEVTIGTDWQEFSYEYTYTGDKTDVSRLTFGFGMTVNKYYIDNVKFTKVLSRTNSNLQNFAETDDEATRVENAIKQEMQRWISGMIEYCYQNANVTAWDVVNEPMSDGNKNAIKSETVDGGNNVPNDAFYWQDYFKTPREYAYWAFKYAREAFSNVGVSDPKLFINDYNLEYSIDKCKGLIAYVNEIETEYGEGCKVDGIATQMHISINQNKDNIREMLTLMAATGKLVKISELDVKVGDNPSDHTAENFQKQAEMYEYVIDTYFEVVPKAQQYGITIWSLSDNEVEHENWIPGDAPNLWDAEYQPKEAYYSVAKALAREYADESTVDSSEDTAE